MRSFISRSVLILCFVGIGLLPKLCEAQIDKAVMQFIGDVIVRTEYGPRHIDFVKRWTRSPTLSTFGDGDQYPRAIRSAVAEINALLPEEIQVIILEPGDEKADIKVFFAAREDYAKIAKENDFTLPKDCVAYFQHWWNRKRELTKAVVLIPSDKKFGRDLRHVVLEEISQSMGAGGDSLQFEDSVFYEDLENQKFGEAVHFSKLDKRLFKFLYQYVPPGAGGIEVGYLLAKHWEAE